MYVPEIFEALSRFLERSPNSRVVIFYAKASGVQSVGCGANQYMQWMPFKKTYGDRVRILVRKDGTFVHAKMIVIDNKWAVVGSANLNDRSYKSDPEMGMAVGQESTDSPGLLVGGDDSFVSQEIRLPAWRDISGIANLGAEIYETLSTDPEAPNSADSPSNPVVRFAPAKFDETIDKMVAAGHIIEQETINPQWNTFLGKTKCALTDPDARCADRGGHATYEPWGLGLSRLGRVFKVAAEENF